MKIISFNINSFGGDGESFEEMKNRIVREEYHGVCTKEAHFVALSRWDRMVSYKKILDLIDMEEADVIVFQEYYINSSVSSQFEREMTARKYELKKNENIRNKQPLSTVIFYRNADMVSDVELNVFYDGRILAVQYNNYIIIGVHMPFNPKDAERNIGKSELELTRDDKKRAKNVEGDWERIAKYLKIKKDSRVITLGDFNVYQRGTNQFNSFVQLFKSDVEMRDLWIECGNNDNTPTYKHRDERNRDIVKAESRLDYVLISSELLKNNRLKINMFPKTDETFKHDWDVSDHRMIIVEVEDEK